MRDIALLTFITLDGVMQGVSSPQEDPSGGFTQGGWAVDYWQDVMAQVQEEAMAKPYDMLFGRKTYEMFAANRPAADKQNPLDTMMDEATKYVATSDPSVLSWQNSKAITGDIISKINDLKRQDGPLLQIHGSWQLIQTLLSHDLIDEFRIWNFPVLLGSGKRLFEAGNMPKKLKLIKTANCPNGVVMTIYRKP